MRTFVRTVFPAVVLALACTAVSAGAGAGVTPADSHLVRRLDSLAVAGMSKEQIVGGTLAFLRGGAVVVRGYGFMDREQRHPVDPDRTPFGISSISKTFTAAAVLQLAERGRLDLDDPVAQHVPEVPLREYRGRPVRVRDLLTHTGGFDEVQIGLAARSPAALVPLDRYLRAEMPGLVRPPGTVTSYSNHGFALAGLLVERVSGVPFARYLRDNVLDPLEMRHSGFEQPLAEELETDRARAYAPAGRELREIPRIYFNDAPASAMYTTAGDMGRFMRFLLEGAAGNTSPPGVLGSLSVAAMLSTQFANHPAVTGLTFGMRELRSHGIVAFEQGGDWQDYSSDLIVAPALGTALFVAFSGERGSEIASALWQAIAEDSASRDAADAASADSAASAGAVPASQLESLTGRYRSSRYSRRSIARLGVLTGAIREVEVTSRDGALHLSGRRLQPVEPDAFRREDTGTRVAFRRDAARRATHLFFENSPYVAYERVSRFDAPRLHRALFAIVVLAAIGGLMFSVRSHTAAAWGSRTWRTMVMATPALETLALGILGGVGATLFTTDVWEFQYGLPPVVRWLLRSVPLMMVLAAVMAAATWRVAVRQEGPALYRGVYVARAAAGILLVYLLLHWRFIP